jgi:hypothetical protein
MDFASFLPGFSDDASRTRLWGLFEQAEPQALRFALPGKWITITSVSAGPTDSWSDGRITVHVNRDEPGVLFHEIFRSAFQQCRFHDGRGDERWGDAFCDAFRYFMESQVGLASGSPWFARMDSLCGRTLEAILASPGSGGPMGVRRCGYPASLIIARAGKDYARFRAIWFDLQEQRMQANQPLLDWKFAYSGCS